ncbi:MAG: tail fiber domain-containing protein [Bacteroidetes bacterium]|nr:tail fiber domain-containing protein [Bacteroidota bacterium]
MKRKVFFPGFIGILLSLFLTSGNPVLAQAPQSFKYQAIARNSSADPLINQAISLKISIRQGTASGTVVYAETQAQTSNQFGLMNLEIGTGIAITGTFSNIDWKTGPYYIEIDMDPTGGSSYQTMGTTQLVSVPYALYSESSGQTFTAGTGINITGNAITNTLPNENHTGDATGASVLKVEKIQGMPVSPNTPGVDQVLKWSGSQWIPSTISTGTAGWSLTGNEGTDPAANFIGTTDNQPLIFKQDGINAGEINLSTRNTLFGVYSGYLMSGTHNTGFGCMALNVGSGAYNTAVGDGSLGNMSGDFNTACGYLSLQGEEMLGGTGSHNTASGAYALNENADGNDNTATGFAALQHNGSGSDNVAVGVEALSSNNNGSRNTSVGNHAIGFLQGDYNTGTGYGSVWGWTLSSTGSYNTGTGVFSLYNVDGGVNNTALGAYALYDNRGGYDNTAVGINSLKNNQYGNYNTAFGRSALLNNTGSLNTGLGANALGLNTIGEMNVAVGTNALYNNTQGTHLVAVGFEALYSQGINEDGNYYSTAVGSRALHSNTYGINNTALGDEALFTNNTGNNNTAVGVNSLKFNQGGSENIAIGRSALLTNSFGYENTSVGNNSLINNNSYQNTAIGFEALADNTDGYQNTAMGYYAGIGNFYGWHNVFIGYESGSGGDLYNSVGVGYNSCPWVNNMILLGNSSTSFALCWPEWSSVSDKKFNKNIVDCDLGLNFIMKLHPVKYELTGETHEGVIDEGFIAQEVEQAVKELNTTFHALHTPQNDKDLYSLAYGRFTVPLVKGMQEQQEMIEKLTTLNRELTKRVEELEQKIYEINVFMKE